MKKVAACRFDALRALSDETAIVHSEEKIDEIIANQSKKLCEKVLSYIIIIAVSDLSDATYAEILVICYHRVSKLKSPEEHNFRLLKIYMLWKNASELKQGNQTYEDIKRLKLTFCGI